MTVFRNVLNGEALEPTSSPFNLARIHSFFVSDVAGANNEMGLDLNVPLEVHDHPLLIRPELESSRQAHMNLFNRPFDNLLKGLEPILNPSRLRWFPRLLCHNEHFR